MTIIKIAAMLACLFIFGRAVLALLCELDQPPEEVDSEVAIKHIAYMIVSGLFIGGLFEMLTA